MLSLIQYEWHFMTRSNMTKVTLIFTTLLGLVFSLSKAFTGASGGFEFAVELLLFLASLIVFVAPVYAGTYIANAFSSRWVTHAVISGKRRYSILLAKTLMYLIAMSLALMIPLLLGTLVITLFQGWAPLVNSADLTLVLRGMTLYSLLMLSALAVNVLIAFYMKRVGATIGLGLAVMILSNGLVGEMMSRPYLHTYLKWFPQGRLNFVFQPLSLIEVTTCLALGFIYVLTIVGLTWFKFRQEELK